MTALCLGMFLLTFLAVEGSDCYTEHHPNGTTTFYINKTVPQESGYSWKITGINHANEELLNSTTVVSRGPHFVTFKRCHEDVTYWIAHTGKIINCSCSCSTMKPPKDSQEDLPTPPTLPTPSSVVSKIVGGVVGGVVFTGVCVCVYLRSRDRGWAI